MAFFRDLAHRVDDVADRIVIGVVRPEHSEDADEPLVDIEDRAGYGGYAGNVCITAQQHARPADLPQLCPVLLRPWLIWARLREPAREDCRAHVLVRVCKQ